jgi:hypothetical protein
VQLELASIGVEGVMGGCAESPLGQCNFSAYLQIVGLVAGAGLQYQVRVCGTRPSRSHGPCIVLVL